MDCLFQAERTACLTTVDRIEGAKREVNSAPRSRSRPADSGTRARGSRARQQPGQAQQIWVLQWALHAQNHLHDTVVSLMMKPFRPSSSRQLPLAQGPEPSCQQLAASTWKRKTLELLEGKDEARYAHFAPPRRLMTERSALKRKAAHPSPRRQLPRGRRSSTAGHESGAGADEG